MSGIADVARHAGVSKATVSRALSGSSQVSPETRRRVRAAAEELGYVPSTSAVSLATGRTRNVGVVMPSVDRWFFARVLEGIQSTLLSRGFDLTLYDARPGTDERRVVFEQFLPRRRFDGLIAVGLEPHETGELDQLLSLRRPIVSVVGGGGLTSSVAIDDARAMRRATEHLLALGHVDIAFLGGGGDLPWASVDAERFEGYRSTMTDAGLHPRHTPSEVSLAGGYAAAVDCLSDTHHRPTAIVAVCDEVAIGAIIAARRLGIAVPGGLSVVGVDNHDYAEMFALTTLSQQPREQGSEAARMLLQQLADPASDPREVRLEARLIVRSSTAPAGGAHNVVVSDTGLTLR
jgi:DNA-binding LacI/PurR family transcriptional regulator